MTSMRTQAWPDHPLRPPSRIAAGTHRLAALIPVLLWGAALWAAPDSAGGGDPALARVNGHEIRLSEVRRSIESLPLGDQIEPRERLEAYTRALVQEEVLLQWAMGNDFREEPELRDQVRDLVFRFLQKKYVSNRIRVTAEDARDYYAANPDLVRGEHLRVRAIVRNSRPECEALQRQIRTEAEFVEKARQASLDKATARQGGDFGYLMRLQGHLGFELELFRLAPGTMGIFDSGGRCYLVWIAEHIDPPVPPFAMVQDAIRAFLANREEQRLLQALLEKAGTQVSVEYVPASASR